MVCLVKIVHLSYTDTNIVCKLRFHMTHITLEFHQVCPTQFSEAVVGLVQIVHLSSIKISTISKWTESSFHLSLVTLEYLQVHPK
jgi:Tfp pilus assembly protein PilO